MGSLTQLLHTARDGLTAQSYGLNVTGQNIANVNTPGYVRREAQLETRALGTQTTGTVHAAGLRRVTDAFLERREYESQGLMSAAKEHDQRLESVEALFNDITGSGLGSSLDAVFQSFSRLAANPSDPTVRLSVLDAAEGFSQRVRDTGNALAQTRDNLLKDAQAVVNQVNENAQAISRLNRQISIAEAQGNDAADLKDQRDDLILGLAGLIDVRTINSDGSIAIQASGITLVEGEEARQLSVDLASDGSMRLLAERAGGGSPTEITRFLTGGKLAGIREARDVDVFAVAQRLDEFVFDVSTAINAQHAQGFGLDGGTLRDVFDVGPTVTGAARALR
ncbi:MAG TPA: flagellar hook-associated protein FlgK, partial [Polyangiaceae bacterium]